jgi:hypothetical protein
MHLVSNELKREPTPLDRAEQITIETEPIIIDISGISLNGYYPLAAQRIALEQQEDHAKSRHGSESA